MKKSRRMRPGRPPPLFRQVNVSLRSRMPERKPKPEPAPSNRQERRAAAAKARKQGQSAGAPAPAETEPTIKRGGTSSEPAKAREPEK